MENKNQNKAVLLVNLGSPDQAEAKDVRTYLNQFLMDRHVIQLPWLIRRMLVSLFILPTRPKASVHAYQSVWSLQGSPLLVLSKQLQHALQQRMDVPVALAMRYGQPSIKSQLQHLLRSYALNEIILVPLYPHFADSTVTTVINETQSVLKKNKSQVRLTIIPPFYQQPDYIDALLASAQPYLQEEFDHLVFSYHGLPELHIRKLDTSKKHCLKQPDCCLKPHPAHNTCYRHQVIRTTELFVAKAGFTEDKYSIAFQSRLGKAKWLTPNTEDVLRELAEKGLKKVLVICPAFVTDCLETLEEIAIRGEQAFKAAGGDSLTLIPCLNSHPMWVKSLTQIIHERKKADEQ